MSGEGIWKSYRSGAEVSALRDVDVGIARGEMVAVMGASGSGKTTLLNCLAGLEQVDRGRVLVVGDDLARLTDDERSNYRARHMGFVFQSFNLLPVLSAEENVEIPLLLAGLRPAAARARAREMLAAVGLEQRSRFRPDQLSGGEQQRVAVARALVHRPEVLWADEPTGNLDSEATEAVLSLLLLAHRDGQTIVLVTHNPALAARAGRTIEMRDGQVVR